jgi:uncharacterized protein (TIRG00374 family)
VRQRTTVALLGALASVIFMGLAVRRLDFGALYGALRSMRVFPWVPLGVASYLTGHVVRGFRCRLLVSREANLPLHTATNVVVVGYAANNVFPARLGELIRAGMLAERTGIPIAQSLTITVIERILDGLAILAVLLTCMLAEHGPAPEFAARIVEVASVVFGGAFIVLVLATYAPGLVVLGASRFGSLLRRGWHDRLVRLATTVTNAGASLRDPRGAALLALSSLLVWCFESGMFLAVMRAFGLPASALVSGVAMSVTNLGLLVPSSPGFIGPFHYFCSRALMAYGIAEPASVAYAAAVHLTFYLPVTLWGAAAMLWYGVEVGATAAMTRAARAGRETMEYDGLLLYEIAPVATHAGATAASPFLRALVEALVVPPGRPADPAVLSGTADFVELELAALPPRLRLLLRLGMTFFRLATRVCCFRSYCELPLERRRAWTKAWAGGKVVLFRRLMKPVQATALLAFYDHPANRA